MLALLLGAGEIMNRIKSVFSSVTFAFVIAILVFIVLVRYEKNPRKTYEQKGINVRSS